MQCLLIYDIPHDGARQKVADACLDYGLQRIQYSAFMGELSRVHQRELFGEIKRRVRGRAANVQLFPLDERSWAGRRTLEQGGERGGEETRRPGGEETRRPGDQETRRPGDQETRRPGA